MLWAMKNEQAFPGEQTREGICYVLNHVPAEFVGWNPHL